MPAGLCHPHSHVGIGAERSSIVSPMCLWRALRGAAMVESGRDATPVTPAQTLTNPVDVYVVRNSPTCDTSGIT